MDSFTDKPLQALVTISAQHQPITVDDLRRLKEQINMVLGIPESEMRQYSYNEMIQHVAKYGNGAVCVGEFVITRRT